MSPFRPASPRSDGPVAAVILAAGAATRMGTLKQLLPYRGGTLLQHAVEQAASAGFDRLVVVLGAEASAVRESLLKSPVELVLNPGWASGMGSSIAAGVAHLQTTGVPPEQAGILLADQPHVQTRHLRAMTELSQRSGTCAVAAEYAGRLGVPAFFAAELFPLLRALDPAAGAGQLLNGGGVAAIPFPLPEAAFDIDTPEDFRALAESVS